MSWIKYLVMGAALWMAAGSVLAVTPQEYVLLDVEIKGLTLEGVSRRLELLRVDPDNIDAQAALDSEIQGCIEEALASYDTTINAHLHYYHANSEAIVAWLDEHPAMKQQLDSIQLRMEELSQQISALVGATHSAQ